MNEPIAPCHILNVNDDPAARGDISRMLKQAGHLVTDAANAAAAVREIERNLFDLALLDVNLPGVDGYTLCARIHQNPQAAHLPVIFLSALSNDEAARARALNHGADGFLSGPVTQDVLSATLKAVLRVRTADARLRESEARFRTLFEFAPDGIYLNDLQGRFLDGNRAAQELIGCPKDELTGKTFLSLNLLSQPDLMKATAALERHAHGEQTGPDEFIINRKDGRQVAVEIRAFPIAIGNQPMVLGVARDISQRKQAEDQLRKLSRAVEQSPTTIVITDVAGNIEYVNPKFTELTGYSAAEAIGNNPRILKAGDMPPAVYRKLWKTITAGKEWRGEMHNRKKNGEMFWETSSISPVMNAEGEITHFLAIKEDITERKRADATVREQAALLDKAQDAILVRDLEHRISYWNQSAQRLYGWSAAEVLGRSACELIYRDSALLDTSVAELLANGEWVGELEQITQTGKPLTVEGHWTLVRDDAGKPTSILEINTDITSRRKLEQQFLRAQRMESIGTLAGGIAHDLNNVLAPIMMAIELLRMGEHDPQRLAILSTIGDCTKRGADMVKQVLSFARGVEGKQLHVQLAHLLQETATMTNETFLKNIQVHCHVQPGLWAVQGDPTQLRQVLLNLCVNARDAMPAGGVLTLSACNETLDAAYAAMNPTAQSGPHVVIAVEDSGCGMSQEVMERIFEPFFTTKNLGEGTGLGLSTSIAIIKSHHGFVQVSSEPGRGSTFRVFIPAWVGAAPLCVIREADVLPRGNGELVLVIDDEAAVRHITRQSLENFGYRVLLASDGAEGAAIYATHRSEIAVVLTDMRMPGLDGPGTIQLLLRINPEVRIIAASGLNAAGTLTNEVGAGIKKFLPKPYTTLKLLTSLREVLHDEVHSCELF